MTPPADLIARLRDLLSEMHVEDRDWPLITATIRALEAAQQRETALRASLSALVYLLTEPWRSDFSPLHEIAHAKRLVAAGIPPETAEAQLAKWRDWVQCVWRGGGPVVGTDDELRRAICEQFDQLAAGIPPEAPQEP